MNCNDRQFLGLNQDAQRALTRRTFLQRSAGGIGLAALGSILNESLLRRAKTCAARASRISELSRRRRSASSTSSNPARRRRWTCSIPSRSSAKHRGEDLPASIRQGQRLTTMTSGQKTFPGRAVAFSSSRSTARAARG